MLSCELTCSTLISEYAVVDVVVVVVAKVGEVLAISQQAIRHCLTRAN